MNYLYEYCDTLSSPVEIFEFDTAVQPFPIDSHWHYFVEILYIQEGTAWVTCNEKTHILDPGQMIFLPPQAVHSIYTTTPQPLKYIVLKFDASRINLSGDYLPKLSSIFLSTQLDHTLPIVFTQKNLPEFSLEDFFDNCLKEMIQKAYGYDSYLNHLLSLFILQLLRCWRLLGYEQPMDSYRLQTHSIDTILSYIDSHSHETLRVADLAEMCHMSYSYFAKNFHELYGKSCKEYIEFVRLCKAENLLLYTDYDLNFISSETGFADCSHLIRCFKKQFHMTPKQYRRKHHSDTAVR